MKKMILMESTILFDYRYGGALYEIHPIFLNQEHKHLSQNSLSDTNIFVILFLAIIIFLIVLVFLSWIRTTSGQLEKVSTKAQSHTVNMCMFHMNMKRKFCLFRPCVYFILVKYFHFNTFQIFVFMIFNISSISRPPF